ncbi:hypothetical protein C8R44DRAFT_888129 [Mycena epipterygia]|nr:hypothetical protein C8R44DRAFT_888129 [Mycena epipterygia]
MDAYIPDALDALDDLRESPQFIRGTGGNSMMVPVVLEELSSLKGYTPHISVHYNMSESLWSAPAGLVPVPQPESGDRPEELPRPSDPTKDWYHYGCLACKEVRVKKATFINLLSAEELAQEPFKSMRHLPTLARHTVECDMWYYRAYAKKLEQTLHRVRAERWLFMEKLRKTQNKLQVLRRKLYSLGGKFIEEAGLAGLVGPSADNEDIEEEDYDTSIPFVMLSA